jgi:hypothetical protein
MTNLRRAVFAAAATAALGLGALAAPASAATLHEAPAAHVSELKNQSVRPDFQGCPVSAFGYAGQMICGTNDLDHYVNGSVTEVFVIGTDWSVWHAWSGSGGWHSLGGQAERSTSGGVFQWSSAPYAFWVYGTDGNQWCDNWGSPNWGGWYLCNE